MSTQGEQPEQTADAPGKRRPGPSQEIVVTLLWCLGVAVVLTLLFSAVSPGTFYWFWGFVFNLIVSLCIGFSIHALFHWVLPPLLERARGRFAYWSLHLLLTLVGVGAGVEVAIRIISAIGGSPAAAIRGDVLRIGSIIALVVVGFVAVFDRLRDKARRVEMRAQEAQREALEARLAALQARTNPHFLFNSLNSVAALIDEDPAAAEGALEKMSRLFRYALDGSKTDWVRLEAELTTIDDYLDVERLRLGDRLRGEIEIEGRVEGLLVPPLLLQPLVENAVLHAVAPRREGGRVEVSALRRGDRLHLAVEDDGPGLGHSPHRGSGGSLADLERRLELAYDGAARLRTHSPPGGGCRVEIELPVREAAGGEE